MSVTQFFLKKKSDSYCNDVIFLICVLFPKKNQWSNTSVIICISDIRRWRTNNNHYILKKFRYIKYLNGEVSNCIMSLFLTCQQYVMSSIICIENFKKKKTSDKMCDDVSTFYVYHLLKIRNFLFCLQHKKTNLCSAHKIFLILKKL